MPGEIQDKIRVFCDNCGDIIEITKEHLDEHPGLCCDCFDVSCGMNPKIKLGYRTVVN